MTMRPSVMHTSKARIRTLVMRWTRWLCHRGPKPRHQPDRGSGDGSSSADSSGTDNADANDKQRGIFDRIKDTFSPNTD